MIPAAARRRRLGLGIGFDEQQHERQRGRERRCRRIFAAEGGERHRGDREGAEQRPGGEAEVGARDQHRQLDDADRQRLDQAELAPLPRTQGRRRDREQDDEHAAGERVFGRPGQHIGAPHEAQRHRGGGEPGPAAPPGDQEDGEVEQRQIGEQADRRRIGAADQSGRQEAADQPHDRGRRTVAQRQHQGGRGDRHHRRRSGRGADQAVEDVAAISGGVEHGEPGADQSLGDARIVGEAAGAGIFAAGDEDQAEQGGRPHPHLRGDQADRETDDQYAGDGECDAADPDQQIAGDQPLEQPAQRFRFARLCRPPLLFGFGFRAGFDVGPGFRPGCHDRLGTRSEGRMNARLGARRHGLGRNGRRPRSLRGAALGKRLGERGSVKLALGQPPFQPIDPLLQLADRREQHRDQHAEDHDQQDSHRYLR